VRAKAEEWLARLLLKHKEKRDQMDPVHRSRHFAALVGVATHMAKRDLGLIISCIDARRKGRRVMLYVRGLKTRLGLRPSSRDPDRHNKPEPTCGNPQPLRVGQGNLEGI